MLPAWLGGRRLNRDAIEMGSRFPWWWRVAPRLKRRALIRPSPPWDCSKGRSTGFGVNIGCPVTGGCPCKAPRPKGHTQGRGPRCSWAVSCGSQGQPIQARRSYDWPVIAVWGLRSFDFGSLRFVRLRMRELIEQANWLPTPDGGFYLNLRAHALEAHPWHHFQCARNRGSSDLAHPLGHTGGWNHQLCPDCIAGSVIGGGFIPQLTLLYTLTFGGSNMRIVR